MVQIKVLLAVDDFLAQETPFFFNKIWD